MLKKYYLKLTILSVLTCVKAVLIHGDIFMLTRRDFLKYLNHINLCEEGCEVGVKAGIFSSVILSIWKGKKLYSIDPWRDMTTDISYIDSANVIQKEHDSFFEETKKVLTPFGNRSKIMRKTSEEAVKEFRDDTLDFVYIDARHDYDSVKEDIEIWYPKVKRGGFICGHDYINGIFPFGNFGVKKAVDEFAKKNEKRVIATPFLFYVLPNWFIQK